MTFTLPTTLTRTVFETTGILYGAKGSVSIDMKPFVKEVSVNGNPIFDPNTILQRLDVVGRFIRASINPLIYATSNRFENALKCFSEATKIPVLTRRFYAGTLSNPQMQYYRDCDVLIIPDPTNGLPVKIGDSLKWDRRAMAEASAMGIPVVAICNSDATLHDVDLCIPANNVGAKAIATVFFCLCHSILSDTDAKIPPLEAFETVVEDESLYSPKESEQL
jgi:small subunit ribosomal protein S2